MKVSSQEYNEFMDLWGETYNNFKKCESYIKNALDKFGKIEFEYPIIITKLNGLSYYTDYIEKTDGDGYYFFHITNGKIIGMSSIKSTCYTEVLCAMIDIMEE